MNFLNKMISLMLFFGLTFSVQAMETSELNKKSELKGGWRETIKNLASTAKEKKKTTAGIGATLGLAGLYGLNQKFRNACNSTAGWIKGSMSDYVVNPVKQKVSEKIKETKEYFEKDAYKKTKEKIKAAASDRRVQFGALAVGLTAASIWAYNKYWKKSDNKKDREDLVNNLETEKQEDESSDSEDSLENSSILKSKSIKEDDKKISKESFDKKDDENKSYSSELFCEFLTFLDEEIYKKVENLDKLLEMAHHNPLILSLSEVKGTELEEVLKNFLNNLNDSQRKFVGLIVQAKKAEIDPKNSEVKNQKKDEEIEIEISEYSLENENKNDESVIVKISDLVDSLTDEQWQIKGIHSLLSEAYKNKSVLDYKQSEGSPVLKSFLKSLDDKQLDIVTQIINN